MPLEFCGPAIVYVVYSVAIDPPAAGRSCAPAVSCAPLLVPGVKLVLGEPFGLPGGKFMGPEWDARLVELKKRQAVVERLAGKYHAALVRYQKVFDEAVKRAPATYWIWDAVHPTYSGHQLMADEWVRVVGSMQ